MYLYTKNSYEYTGKYLDKIGCDWVWLHGIWCDVEICGKYWTIIVIQENLVFKN